VFFSTIFVFTSLLEALFIGSVFFGDFGSSGVFGFSTSLTTYLASFF